MVIHFMEGDPTAGQKAADAYRKSCKGETMEQGQSLAISFNPLVPRQIAGCQTSDLKQREYRKLKSNEVKQPGNPLRVAFGNA